MHLSAVKARVPSQSVCGARESLYIQYYYTEKQGRRSPGHVIVVPKFSPYRVTDIKCYYTTPVIVNFVARAAY